MIYGLPSLFFLKSQSNLAKLERNNLTQLNPKNFLTISQPNLTTLVITHWKFSSWVPSPQIDAKSGTHSFPCTTVPGPHGNISIPPTVVLSIVPGLPTA